jgi:hypothetical protein
MWRLLKLNSPEWKALSLGLFGFMCTGAIMPVFAIFYGEMFNVSSIELRRYSSVVAYIHLVLAVKVGMATCCRLESPGVESRWGRDSPYPPRLALGPIQPPIH